MPGYSFRFIFGLFLFISIPLVVKTQSWDELNGQGMTVYASGDYVQSESIHRKALSIAEEQYGRQSLQYTSSLSNLAYARKALGDLERATENFLEVSEICRYYYGPASLELFEAQLNIINIYLNRRSLDSTETALYKARQTLNSAQNVTPDYFNERISDFYRGMISLSNSEASLYHAKGLTVKSVEVMENLKSLLREDIQYDPSLLASYLSCLNNLSTYYLETGALEKALETTKEFIQLTEAEDDPVQHLYALQSLGSIYRASGMYDSASYTWDRALELIKTRQLNDSELNMVILNNLGELSFELEDFNTARSYFAQTIELYNSRPSYDPEKFRTARFNLAQSHWFAKNYTEAYDLFNESMESLLEQIQHNFTFLTDQEKRAFYRRNLSFIEDYSAFALEISGAFRFPDVPDSVLIPNISGDLYNLQLMTKGIILNASTRMRERILNSDNEVLVEAYSEWEKQKNELAKSYGERPQSEIERLEQSIEVLEKLLVRQSAAFRTGFQIEKYRWEDVQQKLKPGEAAVEIVRLVNGLVYGALIITPETRDYPVFALVKSRDSKFLENEFYKQYLNSIKFNLKDTVSYNVYFRPLYDAIKAGVDQKKLTRIYFSSDGIYNQINLNTLLNPESGKYVLDEVEILNLTNSKELLTGQFNQNKGRQERKAALFGKPSFSLDSNVSGPFNELAGTGVEIDKISSTLQQKGWEVTDHLEEHASEKNLKALESHDILHLATHGFFSDSDQGNADPNITEVLLNSGIALAGANHEQGHLKEDGILTAYETTTLSLDSTQLVVLSACETGLGKYHPGEGVYGLQRSLKSAGVKNIIMSLWKVDDTATQKLMVSFYNNWLSDKTIRKAFKDAQIEIRKSYPEPYYWGAFVMLGL